MNNDEQQDLVFEQDGESRNIVNNAYYQYLITLKESRL
jgi:hypothetical protein